MQSPEVLQFVVHAAELVQVCWQSPPVQSFEQVAPDAHAYRQSPTVQVSVQIAPDAQTQSPASQAKPAEGSGASLPPPASALGPPVPGEELPHAARRGSAERKRTALQGPSMALE